MGRIWFVACLASLSLACGGGNGSGGGGSEGNDASGTPDGSGGSSSSSASQGSSTTMSDGGSTSSGNGSETTTSSNTNSPSTTTSAGMGGSSGSGGEGAGGMGSGGEGSGGLPGTGGSSGGSPSAGTGGETSTTGDGGSGTTGGSDWSDSISLVDDIGRLAIGNRIHIVGHLGSDLVHRSSQDNGANWSSPTVIASAGSNYPAMYGGLFAQGDTVYLLTGVGGDMASAPRQLDFRRSDDNGATWSNPVRVTGSGEEIFRARIVASGDYVHVAGTGAPTPNATYWYFRSTNGGDTWEDGRELATNLGEYGGGQTIAVDGNVVHGAYTTAVNGVGAGPTSYIRSTDNGVTWSSPVIIGEDTEESYRQARVQVTAADGRVFVCWQREANNTGDPLLPDRLGYNTSDDGGVSWGTPRLLPEDTGTERHHQQVWMASGGGVHFSWRHGNDGTDPAGYMRSPDYGATWDPGVIAISTNPGPNHPFSVVADDQAVHLLTAPAGDMQYAYRLLQ